MLHQLFLALSLAILGGETTRDYPECVALGFAQKFSPKQSEPLNYWTASGVLIGPNMVLTTAAILRPGKDAERMGVEQVFLGAEVPRSKKSAKEGRIIRVAKAIRHPEFSSAPFKNDLAILILAENAVNEKPPRWGGLANAKLFATAKSVQIVGFGTTDPSGRVGFGVKRMAEIRLETDPKTITKFEINPTVEFVAADPLHKVDSGLGDSGCPAYVISNGIRYLAGIASRSAPLHDSVNLVGSGGIYTRVDFHSNWIEQTAARHNLQIFR